MEKEIIDLYLLFNSIKNKGWIKTDSKGHGDAGKTFEKFIKNENNDFEIPDYNGIEIKTKRSNEFLFNTLFNCKPDGPYYMETERIKDKYGYPDKDFKEYKVLQTDIFYDKFINVNSKYKFRLNIDEKKLKIFLEIFDLKRKLIEKKTYWDFDSIKEKLYRKMKILAYIHVEKKYSNGTRYYKYKSIDFYKLKDFYSFIEAIKNGKVKITLKVGIFKKGEKLGKTHDHGTGFSIKEEDFLDIYEKIEI